MLQRDETISSVRRYKIYFDNQIEAADYLLAVPGKWGHATDKSEPSSSWDFNLGKRGVQELARKGWSEGAKDLSNRLEVHMPETDHVASWRYDVAGELPDIGRYLSGDPLHMRRHGHPKGHKPIISLFLNNWIACCITATQMANYGAALVSIVDQLENSGRRVEIIGGTVAQHYDKSNIMMSATWRVKAAEDALDLATLAFAAAHPGASRRFGWALWERTDAPADRYYGHGHGRAVTEADLIDPFPGTLILSGLKAQSSRCKTLDDALAFVREEINAAAGEELVTLEAK